MLENEELNDMNFEEEVFKEQLEVYLMRGELFDLLFVHESGRPYVTMRMLTTFNLHAMYKLASFLRHLFSLRYDKFSYILIYST